jgi:F-box and leucine-rich repeat protein 14
MMALGRWARRATFVAGVLACVILACCASAQAEKRIAGAGEEMRFESALKLNVLQPKMDGNPVSLGTTPSKDGKGIVIPAGKPWLVQPLQPDLSLDEMRALSAEVASKRIPGLMLAREQVNDANAAALAGCVSLQGLTILHSTISDKGLAQVTGLGGLKSLRLANCEQVHGKGLAILRDMQGLVRLDLERSAVGNDGMAHIGGATELAELNLEGTDAASPGLAGLKGLAKLKRFSLASTSVGDSGMASVAALTALEELNLDSTTVSDAGVAQLGSLINLKDLIVSATPVKGTTLSAFRGSSLERLTLSGSRADDAGLSQAAMLARVSRLNLRACVSVTDAGLSHVKKLAALRELDLGGCKRISDAGMVHVGTMQNLLKLALDSCPALTDAGLAHLKGMSDLRALNLEADVRLTNAGIAQLAPLVNLEELWLGGCENVSDEAMDTVGRLTHLRVLSIVKTKVSGTGLASLKGLIQLRELDAMDSRVTAADINKHLGGVKGLRYHLGQGVWVTVRGQ